MAIVRILKGKGLRQFSLHVVGADYPNRRARAGGRRFEILLCAPGEAVELVAEPKNPADPNAVAVLSARGVQIGYLTAERAPWIGGMLRQGREVRAVFQQATPAGAAIRVALDGGAPLLPGAAARVGGGAPGGADFWPDYIPPDE